MSISELPSLSGELGRLGLVRQSGAARTYDSGPICPEPLGSIDWQLVVRLRRQAAERIAAAVQRWESNRSTPMLASDRRLQGRALIRSVVQEHAIGLSEAGHALWPAQLENQYTQALENAIFGYGRLQPLFEISEAENIEIMGSEPVQIQFGDGRRITHPRVADSDEELVDAIRFLGETATPPRPFDDLHPTMTLALGERFRLHAIGFGLAFRPSVVIRQHLLTDITLSDLAEDGMLPKPLARHLQAAILARKSIVISGDQGAGKTTLLRAFVAAIHPAERFGTLETDYELLTHLLENRRNVLALQSRVGMGEQSGGEHIGDYTVSDLIPEALRQNLARIVIGEVRGTEAGAMLEALQSGAGAMCTTHSHSASSTIDRLASRIAQGRGLSLRDAMRQIAHHIDFIVHVTLDDQTHLGGTRRRYVAEVRQLTGSLESDRPTTHLVYRAGSATQAETFQPDAGMLEELAPFGSGAR